MLQPKDVAVDRDAFGRQVINRVIWRLVPFIFLCYVVAYIDRVNIGFAATALQRDLRLSSSEFGIGAGLFFFGYFLFEIPSNLILERVGARLWIARIMVMWGLISMGMVFVHDVWSFYTVRVLLGLAEAGFFPGMVLYLTYWIPASERARAGALFMTAAPVAMIVGAPVSSALLTMHGALGVAGWQWLFLLEGLPAVILGGLALWFLTDRPEKATWLSAEERGWLVQRMQEEQAERARTQGGHGHSIVAAFTPKVALLSLVYFLNTLVTYGFFLWLPKILEDQCHCGRVQLSVLTALPFTAALIGMVLIGRHSDRTGERKVHVALCALTASTGIVLAVLLRDNIYLMVVAFALSQVGQRSVMSVFWAIPPIFLGGTAAATGIALINAVGNLGGFFGPTVMGKIREGTGGFTGGLLVLASVLVIEAILVMTLRLPRRTRPTA